MSNPYGGPPSGPNPQQPYGPPSGPQPQQPYGQPGYGPPSGPVPQQPYGPGGQPGYGPPPGYGGVPGQHPAGRLAHWGHRVLASLIDGGIPGVVMGIVYGVGFAIVGGTASSGDESAAITASLVFLGVMSVVALAVAAFGIWNMAYRRGTTGQTLGQQVVKIKTVSEQTAQPIGFGNAFLRHLCHILDGMACYVGFLWPLWDEKNQTFADKIMTTVVVHAPSEANVQPNPGGPGQPGAYPPPGAPGTPGGGFPGQQPGYGPPRQ